MTKNYTISVVLATYNGARYIREQIDSIINQAMLPDEIVCYDDGSKDETLEILKEYRSKFPNLFRIYSGESTGRSSLNFIRAFKEAKGDIIFPCDQDDIWYTDKIDTVMSVFSDKYDIVFAKDDLLSEDGAYSSSEGWEIQPPHKAIYHNYLKGHTCALRRSVVGIYDYGPSVGNNIIWDALLGLYGSLTGRIMYIDKPLMLWRRHMSALSIGLVNQCKNDHRNKWRGTISSLSFLCSHKERKPSISTHMKSVGQFIASCIERDTLSVSKSEANCLVKVANGIAEQTIWSFLSAAINNQKRYIISKENRGSIKKRLAGLLYSFREPFNWFDPIKSTGYYFF